MILKNSFKRSILLFLVVLFCSFYPQEDNKKLKVIFREVGNALLLKQKDSTSLILPVKEISKSKYQISFEKKLEFEPNELVSIIKMNLEKAAILKNYRVEVIQCSDNEVAYSYEIYKSEAKTIIPCSGRKLPRKCYVIEIDFLEQQNASQNLLYYIFIPLILAIIYWKSYQKKKKKFVSSTANNEKILGSFIFYPKQNKLVKQSKEIALSKKECELLEIFIAKANEVIKREELTKKVWEDNGVIVGRSLDTYISKLRKKLKEDTSIKLKNIHGVGYKLEINILT